jgi:CRP-like cAMP-binding protein
VSSNFLLERLLHERPGLRAHVERVRPTVGTYLCQQGAPLRDLFFPIDGTVASVVALASGDSVEVMAVGREGMAGLTAWLGVGRALESLVQRCQGEVARIPVTEFIRAVADHSPARDLLDGYSAYALRCRAQLAACSARHSAEQRVCRWLLTAADRSGGPDVHTAQTTVAEALGLRRQTVGDVALGLQRGGLIAYRRGEIRLLDRPALERLSCECYAALRSLYAEVVAPRLAIG